MKKIRLLGMSFALLFVGCGFGSRKTEEQVVSERVISERVVDYPKNSQKLARELLGNPRIKLADNHVSGKVDRATALDNLQQAGKGTAATLSSYGRAPGGSVYLATNMLNGLTSLCQEFDVQLSEIAGGSHSSRSRHYLGVAFDVNYLNGKKVSRRNHYCRRFMRRAKELGATEVLGPGDANHSGHIHVAWPRPYGE